MGAVNRRKQAFIIALGAGILLAAINIGAAFLDSGAIATNLQERNLAPSFAHLFGTDWLGRDMFNRTIMGLALSIRVGFIGAGCSVIISVCMGLAAATFGKTADRIISWLIDLFLSVPHLVSLILIAFAFGGGMKGIIIGIACTHWPSLARVIRAEALQLKESDYVKIAHKLGKSHLAVAWQHMVPHILPQMLIGLFLMFPHAILHEASITFLGLGLSPHQPAIGIILSESMRYLSSGMWWLAVFPGIGLLIVVRSFDRLGEHLQLLVDPHRSRE